MRDGGSPEDPRAADAPPGTPSASPLAEHRARAAARRDAAARLESLANRISLGRLVTAVAALVLGIAGIHAGSVPMLAGGGACLAAFAVLVVLHVRVLSRGELQHLRQAVHERHILRLSGRAAELPYNGAALLPSDHPYAHDIDLVGPGSLFQRIDVTHTIHGARTLAAWLGASAAAEAVAERQQAVRELAPDLDFREEIEAAAGEDQGAVKMDPTPFLDFLGGDGLFDGKPWLVVLIHVLPVATVGLWAGWQWGPLPLWSWLVPLALSVLLVLQTGGTAHDAFDRVGARRGHVEAFQRMLVLVERTRFEAALLRRIGDRVTSGGRPPSSYLARLDRWANMAELRTQGLVHFFVNFFVLWDLHVLLHLERFKADVSADLAQVFEALGELEALCSLAALAHGDPSTTFPEIAEPGTPFEAEAVAHPLLMPAIRVANDLALGGPGTALIVTGSNMAGKSTLLRAVGLDVALALAGGPVCATRMRLSPVRLRASMRAEDSLAHGASYFHAELTKLRTVIIDADGEPPVFFLLDELLRGTNARARHLGARAVVLHLLARHATGLVATHDVALASLEQEMGDRVDNAHFTDVIVDGEMTFDYQLRPGVVRTSNALHLLRLAGVDVPDQDDGVSPEVASK